jgi:DNA-binding CsgD family transcriptional regulator
VATIEPATPIYGRTEEQITLRALVDAARTGRGGAIVLHGEAGVGKTVLLADAIAMASDFQILRVGGVESELNLGFAALHRLLTPLLTGMHALPDAQRNALEATFGMHDKRADRFLVSLAALTLMTEQALTQPVLCVVDDAQWIDRESLEVIGFVARRLNADRVALLLAMRDGAGDGADLPDALPALRVDGLSFGHAQTLLVSLTTGPLSDAVAASIVARTGGVPLALVEVAVALRAEQLAGGEPLPEVLPIGAGLHRHFQRQLRELPPEAQMLLLVAAAEPTGDVSVVKRATRSLGISDDAFDVAERSHLASFAPVVEFRHPLVRSAVYSGAETPDRRRAHHALADATDPDLYPDRRAWHRADATFGPEEDVALELWRCADTAYVRGGYAAEAQFRTRAGDLTPDPAARGQRLLAAARAHLTGGAPVIGSKVLERASALLEAPADRAEARRLGAIAQLGVQPGRVAAELLAAARMLESIDPTGAREMYADAIDAVMTSYQLSVGTTPREVAQGALGCAHASYREDDVADLLVDGFATRMATGYAEGFPLIRHAFDALLNEKAPLEGLKRFLIFFAQELWDEQGAYDLLRRAERTDRETGALETLRLGLVARGHHEILRGRFDAANECQAEVVELTGAIGGMPDAWRLSFVELYAWQGDEGTTREMTDLLLSPFMESFGSAAVVTCGHMGRVILNVALGRYGDAFKSAWPVFEDDPPARGNQILSEVVKSGVRCGELKAATLACERQTERAHIASTPLASGLVARSNALLATGADAEAFYREALAQLEQTAVAVEVARTRLLFGEWLRRQRRQTDAREHLRAARAQFESIGARAFERRARVELAAAGEQLRRRNIDRPTELTPQESQVARLAATGATNAEIAAQLFISSATVDYHLRKVYRKLDINSRRELAGSAFAEPSK